MTENEKLVKHLIPGGLWQYFAQLSNIPRLSENEAGARNWLINFAKQRKLDFQKDTYGNLVIYKSAQNCHSKKIICLQAHLDMVPAVEPDVEHNFETDPIGLALDGDWLKARGTTLGADNGIGVASVLAILDDLEISHPAIQALFNLEEETGLGGVNNLNKNLLQPDYVVNIDNHTVDPEHGALCIGSSGGRSMEANLAFDYQTDVVNNFWKIDLTGLPGGHSGVDIHKNIPNAIQLLASLLIDYSVNENLQLISISGGEADNAIPTNVSAQFSGKLTDEQVEKLEQLIKHCKNLYLSQYPNLHIQLVQETRTNSEITFLDSQNTNKILQLINSIPSGILAMSQEVAGLVETSNNLGTIKLGQPGQPFGNVNLHLMSRSDDENRLYEITKKLVNLFCLATNNSAKKVEFEKAQILVWTNLSIKLIQRVQGWKPNPESELVKKYAGIFTQITKKPIVIEAVHAGLECGKLLSYYPSAEAISIGPELHDIHTTRERVSVPSVTEFYQVLQELLKSL